MKSTRRGSFSVRRSEKNARFQRQLDKRPLSPGTSREASGVPCLNPRRGLTLLSPDQKSTRLNSSHHSISYAVFCLKKKKNCTQNAGLEVLESASKGSVSE